ncbi:MAG TPA: AI-2E family transporter [Candidatus Paceibacterota bacterium]
MNKDALQRYFFIGLLLAVSTLIFFIFLPFLEVLVLSAILGVVLSPLYRKISKLLNGREGLSAFIVVLIFLVVFTLPFIFLSVQVLSESKDLYLQLTNDSGINCAQKITSLVEGPIQRFYPGFSFNISEFASLGANWLTGHLSTILSSVLSVAGGIVLTFFCIFFFLRDGAKFKKTLIRLSPLSDKYDEQIFIKIKNTITATIKGVIFVAIIQGLLSGFGMFIFGVPNYTLWGSISAIASLVPGLGTAIVFIPAIIYMYAIGNTAYAIGLLIWGTLIVGLVDNFLTPYLYSREVEVHQIIMLFAVLGGLIVFGPIGFIFGPIVIALFFSLVDIYHDVILKDNS